MDVAQPIRRQEAASFGYSISGNTIGDAGIPVCACARRIVMSDESHQPAQGTTTGEEPHPYELANQPADLRPGSSSAPDGHVAAAADADEEGEPGPMLDVHGAHGPVGSWRDFFVHVAIITIGLLIALGLEQTAQLIHHRHEVADTRQALRRELQVNRDAYAGSVREFYRQTASLLNDIAVLEFIQQHPGTPEEQLPGILVWHASPARFTDSAWKTAQESAVTALMPQEEVRRYAALYDRIDDVRRSFDAIWTAIVRARLYSVFDSDPTHLSASQVTEEIALTKQVLVQHFASAASLVQLNGVDPAFTPALTKEELNRIMHVLDTEDDPRLVRAIMATNERLPADAQLPVPPGTTKLPGSVPRKSPYRRTEKLN
jgi:hypothetical protein